MYFVVDVTNMSLVKHFFNYFKAASTSSLLSKRLVPLSIARCERRYSCIIYLKNYENRRICKDLINEYPQIITKRMKFKKPSKREYDSDADSSDDEIDDKKLVTGHVTSLRTDAILKAGLGMARNKVETCFYESRIRVNGKKILKKSHQIKVGDEVDIINEESQMKENLLTISRVILKSAKANEDGDKIVIKMQRFKSLVIEDYDENPWKS